MEEKRKGERNREKDRQTDRNREEGKRGEERDSSPSSEAKELGQAAEGGAGVVEWVALFP